MRIHFLRRKNKPQSPRPSAQAPPRLIIHAGTHKTGTTSIQNVLTAHREDLAKQGILYPDHTPFLDGSRKAHHSFAQALVGIDEPKRSAADQFIEHIKQTAGPNDVVILSSESIYRHVCDTSNFKDLPQKDYWEYRLCYLERLRDAVEDTNPEILLYLRSHDTFAESAYKEWIINKSHTDLSFFDWIEENYPLLDYNRQISAFQQIFPTVTIRSYEHAKDEGLLSAFFRELGPTPPPRSANRRASPDARLILWIRHSRCGTWKQRRHFASSDTGRTLFNDRQNPTLWPSTESRDAFIQRFDEGPYGASFFSDFPSKTIDPAYISDHDIRSIDEIFLDWLKNQEVTGPSVQEQQT